jgi:hypothetical protein
VAIDYATKWVEAKALKTNIATIITKFLHECIPIGFGCPLTIVTNQGVHFINYVIKHLIDHFYSYMSIPLLITHKEMVKLNPPTRYWEHA